MSKKAGKNNKLRFFSVGKKAQITIFIIIGILMLFIFAGILYFSKTAVKEKITEEGEPVLEKVPSEFAGIKAFTENCLQNVGKKGLLILGQQGGYIYPDLLGEFSVSEPTDSLGLNLEPTKVPYWYYNTEPNKGNKIAFSSLEPKLYYKDDPELSVEAQLGRFVGEQLDSCLENYTAFKKQGFNISKGEKETKVNIDEGSVGFTLSMPLEMSKGKASSKMNTFFVRIPLDLKHYYEVADLITGAEKNFSFLERQGLNLISIFSGKDTNKLPPTSATGFELAPTVFWNEGEVKEDVKRVLSSYIPMLRFLGSDNFYDYVYPDSRLSNLYQSSYDQMVVNMRGAEDLEVNFDYFNWPIYLKTNSANGVIKPFNFFEQYNMLKISQQTYETNYDISYPVLITLRDASAFNGEGYDFIFSLEGNIRNNGISEDGEVKETFPKRASRLACKEELRDTGLLKTVVVDSFTKEPVKSVQIGFSIPEQDDCQMGLTDSKGEFESKYPSIYGGVMNFIKQDYLTSFYPIDTYRYKEKPGIIGYAVEGLGAEMPEKVVEMHKFKKINVTIKKKNLEKCIKENCFFSGLFSGGKKVYSYKPKLLGSNHSWVFSGVTQPLKDTEQAIITLNRIGDLNKKAFSQDFSTAVTITGDTSQEIELVPGIYEVTGNLVLNEEVVIPKEERCTGGVLEAIACWDPEGCCFTFNETRMEKYTSGQIAWDKEKSYLRITPEELYPAKEITFYILNQNIKNVPPEPHKRVIEDLQVIGEMANISKLPGVRKALEPRFS